LTKSKMAGAPLSTRLKGIDFYRKINRELTEGTLAGASVSLITAFVIVFLVGMELSSYLTVQSSTRVVIDRSADELLKINFNITFPHLECQFASVDVSDVLGRHKVNITKTVHKWKIDENMKRISKIAETKTPEYGTVEASDEQVAVQLSPGTWDAAMAGSKLVLVNFYAPWCPWSRQLGPVWEHTAGLIGKKYSSEIVSMGKVDCTAQDSHALCHSQHVNAFPSIRVYRGGSDTRVTGMGHEHNAYYGDRTPEALVKYIDSMLTADDLKLRAIGPGAEARDGEAARGSGCSVAGFVRVARVPGNLHVSAHSVGFSFDHSAMNVSHIVHHLSFGEDLDAADEHLLPEEARTKMGLLDGRTFLSKVKNVTHEHYLKVVLNTFQLLSGKELNTYEFTANSNKYTETSQMPMARFSYDLSPMQVVVSEHRTPFSHFITQLCAIIGGIFTVAGIIDSLIFHLSGMMTKKLL